MSLLNTKSKKHIVLEIYCGIEIVSILNHDQLNLLKPMYCVMKNDQQD